MIDYEDFLKVDMRVGKILTVEDFPEAKRPAYKLKIDFGEELGIKKSSAQITQNYTKEDLINRKIVAVVNFGPKQIGPFISEVLVLGSEDENKNIVLLNLEKDIPVGNKIY